MDQHGWSVRDLSYEARVPYTTVKRLSEHAVSQIHIPTVTALAKALGCQWTELVELVEVDEPDD
ncbi:helix-turn-helix transcriptional regulator [Leptolyngbya sp. FACHB-261]|nr:helix-turn-helix transcriptional regulator [Leptolyngbya sp. FACHB-261]